jgi:hypothetical protein
MYEIGLDLENETVLVWTTEAYQIPVSEDAMKEEYN